MFGDETHAVNALRRIEQTASRSTSRFGMGLHQNRCAGVFLRRIGQHLAELGPASPHQRSIPLGLVNHHDIARGWRFDVRINGGVFPEMPVFQAVDGVARPVQKCRVIQRVCRQQRLKVRRRVAVEMHAAFVEVQANRRGGAHTVRVHGPQERIFHRQNGGIGPTGYRLASPCRWGASPDADPIVGPGHANGDVPTGQPQNAFQAALGKKAA